MSQRAKNAAGPQGIGDALIHPILQRDLIILPELFDTARLKHYDDIVGAFERFTPVGRGDHRRVNVVVTDHPFHKRMHLVQTRPGQCHQPILAAFERGGRQEI